VLAKRTDKRAVGSDGGVGLVAGAGLQEQSILVRRPPRDLGEIELHPRLHVRRDIATSDRILKVILGDAICTELEMQHAKLELDARQMRIEEQHALERADCGLVV